MVIIRASAATTRRSTITASSSRDLLALRRRDVDRRVHDGLSPLAQGGSAHGESISEARKRLSGFLLITIGAFALIVMRVVDLASLGSSRFLALSAAAVAVYLRQRGPRRERDARRALADRTRGACSSSRTRRSGAGAPERHQHARRSARRRLPRRLPGSQLAPEDVHVGRGSGTGGAPAAPRRDDRAARVGRDRRHGGGRATAIRSSPSTTRCGRSVRTRSCISTHPPGSRTGSSAASCDSVRARYDVPVTHVVVDLPRCA
jgi:hypothetical protein